MDQPRKEKEEREEMKFDGVWVMMNGISGKMGIDVAAACLRKGFRIAPYAMSGKGSGDVSVSDLAVRFLFFRVFCAHQTDHGLDGLLATSPRSRNAYRSYLDH